MSRTESTAVGDSWARVDDTIEITAEVTIPLVILDATDVLAMRDALRRSNRLEGQMAGLVGNAQGKQAMTEFLEEFQWNPTLGVWEIIP